MAATAFTLVFAGLAFAVVVAGVALAARAFRPTWTLFAWHLATPRGTPNDLAHP